MHSARSPNSVLTLMTYACVYAFAGEVLAQVTVPAPTTQALALGQKLDLYWIAERILALAIPFLFLFSGWGSRLCANCKRIARGRWFWTVTLFASIYVVLTVLISLPLNYERHFVVPHAIGRSHRSLTEWRPAGCWDGSAGYCGCVIRLDSVLGVGKEPKTMVAMGRRSHGRGYVSMEQAEAIAEELNQRVKAS